MGKTWKDKNKWEKKQEGKNIKKSSKEHKYSSGSKHDYYKDDYNPRISSFEWYDYDYEND
jgi:hypothetical protein